MTRRSSKRQAPMGAADFMSQRASDPDYQRRAQAAKAQRELRAETFARASAPIVADLRRAGLRVDSIWELPSKPESYPAALPVLIDHLERGGYPESVTGSVGQALAVKPALLFWDRLTTLYLNARDAGEEEAAAVALAGCATKSQVDDLIGFLPLRERGLSRIYFLRPLLKVGGARGREVVEGLVADPVFGEEATALLGSRNRS